MVAARLMKLLEPAAKERQRKAGGDKKSEAAKSQKKSLGPNLAQPKNTRSADEAAKSLNVGKSSVKAAAAVIANGSPELVAAVDRGEVAVSKAAQIANPEE